LAGGLLAISVLWFVGPRQYTAVALLHISANEQQLVFQTDRQASSFEIYKGTQQQEITSDVVLIAALRNAKVASLVMVQREDDPVRWLAKNLRVEFPGNAEIMRFSLVGKQPDEVAVLVNAVVDAYMNEVVSSDRDRKTKRFNEVDRLCTEKETQMRRLRTELKQLTEQLGTGDTGALGLRQQIALQAYTEARNELSRLRAELRRAKDDLKIKQILLNALQSAPQQSPDADATSVSDLTLTRLIEQVGEIETRLATIGERVKERNLKDQITELMSAHKAIESKLAELRKELAAKLQKMSRMNLETVELKARIEILEAQEKEAVKDLDEQRKNAEKFGNSSIDVEMMRSELQNLDKVLAPIAEEREKLKVELESVPRISVFQRAEAPKTADPLFVFPDIDSKTRQRMLIVLIVLAAILLPASTVLWFSGRRRRSPA